MHPSPPRAPECAAAADVTDCPSLALGKPRARCDLNNPAGGSSHTGVRSSAEAGSDPLGATAAASMCDATATTPGHIPSSDQELPLCGQPLHPWPRRHPHGPWGVWHNSVDVLPGQSGQQAPDLPEGAGWWGGRGLAAVFWPRAGFSKGYNREEPSTRERGCPGNRDAPPPNPSLAMEDDHILHRGGRPNGLPRPWDSGCQPSSCDDSGVPRTETCALETPSPRQRERGPALTASRWIGSHCRVRMLSSSPHCTQKWCGVYT